MMTRGGGGGARNKEVVNKDVDKEVGDKEEAAS
jgi:hypothetical protein